MRMRRPIPDGSDAVAGKRFTVRSRSIRWREGRYKGRRRSSRRPHPKSRPVVDALIALPASLIAAFLVLCMAFSLSGSYGIPLYVGYGGLLAAVTIGCLVLGPRDRGGRMIAAGLALVCIAGTLYLYGARPDVHYHPHSNARPQAAGRAE